MVFRNSIQFLPAFMKQRLRSPRLAINTSTISIKWFRKFTSSQTLNSSSERAFLDDFTIFSDV